MNTVIADIVIAGADQDTVLTESGDDIVLGDSGEATFNSDLDAGVLAEQIGILRTINSLTAAIGDNDTITTDEGSDIVIGGAKDDSITVYLATEVEADTVLGDSGQITFEVDGSIKTIATTDSGIGGSDTIHTQNGSDIVIGGTGGDIITTGTDASGDTARDIVLGDEGSATFDSIGRLDAIESTNTDIGGNDHIPRPDLAIGGLNAKAGSCILNLANGAMRNHLDASVECRHQQATMIFGGMQGAVFRKHHPAVIEICAHFTMLLGAGHGKALDAFAFVHLFRVAHQHFVMCGGVRGVKPANAQELLSQPDVDGALVGGASLEDRSFSDIINSTRN